MISGIVFPQSVGAAIGRWLGSQRAFLDDVDATARKKYEDRVRGTGE